MQSIREAIIYAFTSLDYPTIEVDGVTIHIEMSFGYSTLSFYWDKQVAIFDFKESDSLYATPSKKSSLPSDTKHGALIEWTEHFVQTKKVLTDTPIEVIKEEYIQVVSAETLQSIIKDNPYVVHNEYFPENHLLVKYLENNEWKKVFTEKNLFSFQPDYYVNGVLKGEKKLKYVQRYYTKGLSSSKATRVFFWDNPDSFRITVNTLVVEEEENSAKIIPERFCCSIKKDTGAVYLSKGNQVRWGTYGTSTSFNVDLSGFLDLLEANERELIASHFRPRLAPWRQSDYEGDFSASGLANLLFEHYFKPMQYIQKTDTLGFRRFDSGLNLNAYSIKCIKRMRSQQAVTHFLYPHLGKKQANKIRFITGKDELHYNHSISWTLHFLTDPNHLNTVLEIIRYKVPLTDFGGKQRIRRLQKTMDSFIDRDTFVRLLMKCLKKDNQTWVISDIYRALLLLIDEKVEIDPFIGNTLEELHDFLYTYIKVIEDKYFVEPIVYSKKERKLEDANESYTLELANHKKELVDVGNAMNICVGSYGEDVFKKKLTILTVKEKETNKPVLCIELHKNRIVQAKKKFNNSVQWNESLGEFFHAWAQKNRLTIDTKDYVTKDTQKEPVQQF